MQHTRPAPALLALLALLALFPLNRGAPYACLTLDHLQLLGVQAVRGQERKVPVGGTTVTVSVECSQPFVCEVNSMFSFFLPTIF